MKLVIICIIVIGLYTPSILSQTGRQHWRIHDIIESIVLITAYNDRDSAWLPHGTGVFIDIDSTWPDIYLLTNQHIFNSRDSFIIKQNFYYESDDDTSLFIYEACEFTYVKNGNEYCPSTEDSDFVIIPIPRPPDSLESDAIPARDFISFDRLDYGMDVEFYGFPNYLDWGLYKYTYNMPILRSGSISYFSYDKVFDGKKKILMPGMLLIDGVSIGGNSGGPVFAKLPYVSSNSAVNYKRKFIGIISGHYHINKNMEIVPGYYKKYTENSNLAFVISISTIMKYFKTEVEKNRRK